MRKCSIATLQLTPKGSWYTSSSQTSQKQSLFKPHFRDVRIIGEIESPGLVSVLPGIIDSDTRAGEDRSRIESSIFDPQRLTKQVFAVEPLVYGHRHTQLSGTTRDICVAFRIIAKLTHEIQVFQGFNASNQHCCRITFSFHHNI